MGEHDEGDRPADAEEFVELLMSPLKADDPQRQVLRHDLRERLKYSQPQAGDDTAQTARAWLTVRGTAGGRSRRRVLALWAAVLAIFLGCAGFELWRMAPLLADEGMGPAWMKEETLRQLYTVPPEEAPVAAEEALPFDEGGGPWRAHPENPVLYFTYAKAFSLRCRRLPANYEATWRKIDPDNGIWLIIQAFSISQVRFHRPPLNQPETEALLREAAVKPRIEAYDEAWDQYVIDHLRAPETAAQELMIRNRLGAQRAWARQPWLWEPGIPLTSAAQAGTSPGTPEWEAYEKISRWIGAYSTSEAARKNAMPRISAHAAPALVVVTPGCQAGLLLAALLFVGPAAGLLALRQLPAGGRAGRMASCLAALERPGDRWRLLAVAVPLPLALGIAGVLAIQPDRPLGGLGMAAPGLMFLALVAIAAAGASWQISRQTAFLGLASTPPQRKITTVIAVGTLSILAIVTTLVAVSRAGLLPPVHDPAPVLTSMAGLCGVVLLCLGGKVMLGYTNPETNVRHRLIARRLLPVVLISAMALCFAALSLHAVERWAVEESQRQEGMRSW